MPDQYISSIAATYCYENHVILELPLLLSAALVYLLRVHPALADHVGYLGYVPKLVSAMAYKGSREAMATEGSKSIALSDDELNANKNKETHNQMAQEHVRLSYLHVLCQLASSTTIAEAMEITSAGYMILHFHKILISFQQFVPLLMKEIGWQGGCILALKTLKHVAGNRVRDALVAQGLKVLFIPMKWIKLRKRLRVSVSVEMCLVKVYNNHC